MNEKGFTLVELLITIVIVGIVATLASYGAISVSNATKKNLLVAKQELILIAAEKMGEDKWSIINSTCTPDGQTVENCIIVSVAELIEEGYLSSSEECNGVPCMRNDVTGKSMNFDEIAIYKRNNRIETELILTSGEYNIDPQPPQNEF